MADGVLHERLQQEGRHGGRARAGLDAERHLESIAEASLLDRDVMIEQLQLLLQRHQRTAFPAERMTQQLAQARDHAVGLLGVLEHERRDRMQRVEEEMRLQLAGQRVEPRLHQLTLEPRGADGVIQADDHRVDENVERPVRRHGVGNTRAQRQRGRAVDAEGPLHPTLGGGAEHRDGEGCGDVHRDDAEGVGEPGGTGGEGGHEGGERRPGPPPGELPTDDPAPRARSVALESGLNGEKEGDRRPSTKYGQDALHMSHCTSYFAK